VKNKISKLKYLKWLYKENASKYEYIMEQVEENYKRKVENFRKILSNV